MNNTRRGLNRLFSFIVGLVVFILGIGAIVLVTVPAVRDGWKQAAPEVLATVSDWFAAAIILGTNVSWWWIAVITVLLLVIVLLLVFILRQGHGQTTKWMTDTPTDHGTTSIEARVAEDLVQDTLDSRTDLVSSHVSTYLVSGTPVLKVAVTARRGVSPKDIVDDVERSIEAMERLVGKAVPVSIQISGGFRSRVAKSTRLQ